MEKWICRNSCYIAGFGCVDAGTVVDIDHAAITPRFKKNFAPLNAKEAKEAEDRKSLEGDLTYNTKVQRLKDLKVKIPPHASKEVVDKLFAEHAEAVELPEIV